MGMMNVPYFEASGAWIDIGVQLKKRPKKASANVWVSAQHPLNYRTNYFEEIDDF